MLRPLALAATLLLALAAPARAIIGGQEAGADLSAHVVMLSSDRGSFCSAVVIAPDLLLTAGHCVRAGANYRLLTYAQGRPVLSELGAIAVHPGFDESAYEGRKFIVDLALVQLKAPLAGYAALP